MITSQAAAPSNFRYVEHYCKLCRTHVANLEQTGCDNRHALCTRCIMRNKKQAHLKPSCPMCREDERKQREWNQKRSGKDQRAGPAASQSLPEPLATREKENLFVLAGNLSTEGALAVLDCVESFMEDAKEQLDKVSRDRKSLMHYAFKVIDELLSHEQSARVIQHLMSSLQTFLHKFKKVVYAGNTQVCYKLCSHMFNYCGYDDYDAAVCVTKHEFKTRELASAFMYLLMRENFRYGTVDKKAKNDKDNAPANIARIKMQATIALSEGIKPETHDFLKKSLGMYALAISMHTRA